MPKASLCLIILLFSHFQQLFDTFLKVYGPTLDTVKFLIRKIIHADSLAV